MTPARIAIVGPLPPPSGGMANQTLQLAELLRSEGVQVEVVRTNPPYHPAWVGRLRGVRALWRMAPYLVALWRASGRAQLVHVMANSGWSWHLFAAPAIWIAHQRRVPVVVNYRGGDAERFFADSFARIKPTLARASTVVVPSRFLASVFARYGVATHIVPNIIDLARFPPRTGAPAAPHLIVTRNLEPIYDVGTAIRAFALVRKRHPDARLTIAGDGPARADLAALAVELAVADGVTFSGSLENREISNLYGSASLMLNPSTVDNMPISILEAWASGVPVVSTNAGGVPYLVDEGRNALLVDPQRPDAMADAALRVLESPDLASSLTKAGRAAAEQCAWPNVREAWFEIYAALVLEPAHAKHARTSE
jgi:glycosyltransferase involved in cell wall biosynthesis